MKNYLKFLKRLPKDLRSKVIETVFLIASGDLANLDIKKMSDEHDLYRCRIGKIRILFQKRDAEYFILDIGFRGDVYK